MGLLKAHRVEWLVDVRTVPRSRHNPRFNRESLPESLASEEIRYEHLRGLGWPAPREKRLAQFGLEEPQLSRLRRLHVDSRI